MAEHDPDPVLEYANARRPKPRPWPGPVMGTVIILLVVLLFVSMFIPGHSRRSPKAEQVMCASNLWQIGQGMFLYVADHGGGFPDFATLLANQPIDPAVFVCPTTDDRKAEGADRTRMLADFQKRGRCSYVYVDAGLAPGASPEAILAFEDPANHDFHGGNVLYADGHVDWIGLQQLMWNLKDLAAGVNPPKSPPMASEADAVKEYEANWRGRMPMLKTQDWRSFRSAPR